MWAKPVLTKQYESSFDMQECLTDQNCADLISSQILTDTTLTSCNTATNTCRAPPVSYQGHKVEAEGYCCTCTL